jgi:hypothetical protein
MMMSIGEGCMSLIKDIRFELQKLDLSKKTLRTFGIVVGTAFVLIVLILTLKDHSARLRLVLGTAAFLLIGSGVFYPRALMRIYPFWMGVAFTLGWVVSRFLLILLFFLVLTPIGLVGRLVGKEFLNIKSKRNQDSYWVEKKKESIYHKMY